MADFTKQSCVEFTQQLAARQPVPGGGGASALVGALASALGSMAANYTQGKARYADVSADMERMVSVLDELRGELLDLVEADANAFAPLSQAYRLDKDDPERAKTLEAATHAAAEVPVQTMQKIGRVIEVLEEMSEKAARSMLSDVGCAAYLARAALEAASLNVYVNTRDATDHVWAQQTEATCGALLNLYVMRAQAIADEVVAYLRRKK